MTDWYIVTMAILVFAFIGTSIVLLRQKGRLVTKLTATEAELSRVNQVKDEFLANTSHELRTPLNGIIGLTDSLIGGIGGPLNVVARDNLMLIQSSARRLSSLVNDILDYSKMSHEELRLNLETVDLTSVASLVLTTIRPLAGSKGLALQNTLPPTLYVRADTNRLQQILYNLLGNAIKYTEEGAIGITARAENGTVFVEVWDTGMGIPSDKVEDIFESFRQLDGSLTRMHEGTGLGLAITKALVELHGGTITVDSTVDEGSRFTFTVPAATAPALVEIPNGPVPATQEDRQVEVTFAPDAYKILIVDDDSTNTRVVRNYLQMQGWQGVEAHSGEEALGLLSTDTFDLVLLDVMMPRMSGYEVCRVLRQTYDKNQLPVLMLTIRDDVELLVEGFDLGANDYLRKPFFQPELIARIQQQVQGARSTEELRDLKEGVQLGTDYIRHAVNGHTATLNIFTEKIADYAHEHQLSELCEDAQIMMDGNRDLIALVGRVKSLTADLELQRQNADMIETLERVLVSLKDWLHVNKVDWYTEYAPEVLNVYHDPVHMSEVFRNLIQNAVEAMRQQPIRKLRFRIMESDTWYQIEMKDTGAGIAPNHVSKIFEKYFTTKRSAPNFGLGLYYSAKVLEKHGGRIQVKSSTSGTTMILLFPRDRGENL